MKFIACLCFTLTVFTSQLIQAQGNYKSNNDTLYAIKLKPIGRYLFNDKKELELISSAVHFGITFTGKQCEIYVALKDKNDHNYIQYEVDGIYKKRIRFDGKDKNPLLIKTGGIGKHTVWIYKTTEAHSGAIIINKIVAQHVKSITPSKNAMIEFIGNSITCGAAADTTDLACNLGEYKDHHNAYMAYGPRVARSLGVNYMLSSVSGIGIYRTWNMEGPSMPQVYENTDFQLNNSNKWNFKTYSPKIVSIALGTNDISLGDKINPRKSFDEALFISNYVDFIRLVKSKYPKTQIVLLNSPMVKNASGEVLKKCLQSIKLQSDIAFGSYKPVQLFFFNPIEIHGCGGHPSVEDHLLMAKQLIPFLKKILAK